MNNKELFDSWKYWTIWKIQTNNCFAKMNNYQKFPWQKEEKECGQVSMRGNEILRVECAISSENAFMLTISSCREDSFDSLLSRVNGNIWLWRRAVLFFISRFPPFSLSPPFSRSRRYIHVCRKRRTRLRLKPNAQLPGIFNRQTLPSSLLPLNSLTAEIFQKR